MQSLSVAVGPVYAEARLCLQVVLAPCAELSDNTAERLYKLHCQAWHALTSWHLHCACHVLTHHMRPAVLTQSTDHDARLAHSASEPAAVEMHEQLP